MHAVVASSPLLQQSHWGAKLVHLKTGEVLYSHNETSHFTPASNTKLFSTSLALARLGSNHRMTTRIVAEGPLKDGILHGNLALIGSGDPTLSGRPMPYQYKAAYGDSLGPLDELVDQAFRAGLRRVSGDIVGDDSAYVYEPYPEGWALDDTLYYYGAPVSALILHDNAFTIRIEGAGTPGLPARLSLDPPNSYFTLQNRIRTVVAPPHKISMDRAPGGRTLELWGAIKPSAQRELEAGVDDPSCYAAFAVREALQRRGIQVDGGIAARHRQQSQSSWAATPNSVELARRTSPPLSELIQVTNKVSQNLWAEICLREVARMRGAEPSRAAGLEQLQLFLSEMGTDPKEYNFEDGSGLSRLTLVTPAAVVRLLAYMERSAEREAWINSLPVGGEDGSLGQRFKENAGAVRAKTGTLTHVTALAGYLDTKAGERLAFSIVVNNANASATAIRQAVDKIVVLFLNAGV
ncbi:MAG: D-alanyl-D-alanine carboxypeptidase/D-alanyl-D-alanine-endopeptidase [Bryobacterales bacterium]|nr:D-alanyl-D-alanine carboxypeptidase/D-alanyl-D-alanine-endopeptidase [Bryobacterales bacterium]